LGEAPAIVQKLLENPVELEALRAKCYAWWLEYKKTMKREIADLINESFFSLDK
jgi:hypothetical protein